MSAGHDGQPQANQQPLIPDVASLPSDRCSVESLATQSELLVSGDAPSLYTHDQIEPILPSGSQVDVSVVAVLKLADGQECWVAAVSAKPGSSHAAHIKTVKHPSGREGAVVSHKQFFLVNPRAVIEDRESGALSKGRSSGVAPIGADPESAITIALNPNTEDAHDATTRCRLIIQEDGKLLVSNNGKDTVDVVIDSREHRDAQGIQSSAAIVEVADNSVNAKSDALIESASEVHQPSAADIFGSPEAFQATLADEHLDPTLRGQLETLQEAWHGVQVAAEANDYWKEQAHGQLISAGDILGILQSRGATLEHDIEETQEWLSRLQLALEYGDFDEIQSAFQRYNFNERFEGLRTAARALDQQGADTVSVQMQATAEQVGDYYRAMTRYSGELGDRLMERMVAECNAQIDGGASINNIIENLTGEYGDERRRWQVRATAFEPLAELARRTNDQTLEIQFNRVVNQWEDILDSLRAGRMDPGDINYVRYLLGYPLEEAQYLRRLSDLTRLAAEDVV